MNFRPPAGIGINYEVYTIEDNAIIPYTIIEISFYSETEGSITMETWKKSKQGDYLYQDYRDVDFNEIDKVLFFTKEDAENCIKGGKQEQVMESEEKDADLG